MQTFKKQQGMATILLVLLIGITVMLITASVARALMTKKEAATAAHAQTNAQILGWSGVSAFREFLVQTGGSTFEGLDTLKAHGYEKTLTTSNGNTVKAKNIIVTGCATATAACSVTADIYANNSKAKAGTTITVVYELNIVNNTVTVTEPTIKASLGGDTYFHGGTIRAEGPSPSAVVLNIDGKLEIDTDFTLENISSLTFNVDGDVRIVCSHLKAGCSQFHNVDINAKGNVHISDDIVSAYTNLGNIYAEGNVTLQTHINAKNIYSLGNVNISLQSTAQDIQAVGDVTIFDRSHVGHISSNRNVEVNTNSSASSVRALGYVWMHTNGVINGDVYARGDYKTSTGNDTVRVGSLRSEVTGTIYAHGDVSIPVMPARARDIYTTGDVSGTGYKGSVNKNLKTSPLPSQFTPSPRPAVANYPVDPNAIRQHITPNLDFKTLVDVTKYKLDANYIFQTPAGTLGQGFNRVFLNHLKNPANGDIYVYGQNSSGMYEQQIIKAGTTTPIKLEDGKGVYIADYGYPGFNPSGALCHKVSSRTCTSEIIGFFPRVGSNRVGITAQDYDHTALLPPNVWELRTGSANSTINNATYAPGIFYFDGRVDISGPVGTPTTAVYTNTILSEGDITFSATSPTLYSPYNVVRNGNPDLICDRTIKTVSGGAFASNSTTPTTLSNKFLIPINLCKTSSEFSYSMNRNPNDSSKWLYVNIDGQDVPKLDLGYVAFMSNGFVDAGTCSIIYGDILARDVVRGSHLTTCKNGAGMIGNISSQGVNKNVTGNSLGTGSVYTIPQTNTNVSPGKTTTTTTSSFGLNQKWARYK